MPLPNRLPVFVAGLLTCLWWLSLSPRLLSAEIPSPVGPPDDGFENFPAAALDEALRQLKEQQSSTVQALDFIRRDTDAALRQNASLISNQLAQLSLALVTQSDRQFDVMRGAEKRNLRVTLFILGIVLFAGAAVVWLAARALEGLVRKLRSSSATAWDALPPPSLAELPNLLLDQAATSAYTAALGDVEKRLVLLEQKQIAAAVVPARRESLVAQPKAGAAVESPAPSPKPKQSPRLAMALGDGEAILFLPYEQAGAPRRLMAWFTRLGRFFTHNRPPRPSMAGRSSKR